MGAGGGGGGVGSEGAFGALGQSLSTGRGVNARSAVTSRSTSQLSQSETNAAASRAGLGGSSNERQSNRLGQSGVIQSRTTTPLSVSSQGPLETAATSPMTSGGITSRTTSVIPPDSPTLRLTNDGLLLTPNNNPPTSEGNRLGDNQGGGGQDNAGQPPPEPAAKPAAPATPPAAPSPPQQPRQRAAALQRGPAVEQPRTLLTLSLADVTKKSLLGV